MARNPRSSRRTILPSFQMCESGKHKLQPLIRQLITYSFKTIYEAEINLKAYLPLQLLIFFFCISKIYTSTDQPQPPPSSSLSCSSCSMTPFVNLTEPACRTLLFCPQRCLLSPPGRKHWIFPSNLRKRKNHIHHSRPTALLPQLSPTLTITCHCFEPISVLKLQIFRNDVQTGDNGEKERSHDTYPT